MSWFWHVYAPFVNARDVHLSGIENVLRDELTLEFHNGNAGLFLPMFVYMTCQIMAFVIGT